MRNAIRSTRLVLFLVLVFSLIPATALADSTATIDFEGLTEGQIVSSVSSGSGISGDTIPGSVGVEGFNPTFAGVNAAMIFDATCGGDGSCTGEDPDLEFPAQGNILIVSEDLDATDPDDSAFSGSSLSFDFSTFGPGVVTVESLWVGDTEEGGTIELYDADGVLITTVPLPMLGDHQETTLNIGVSGVESMVVTFGGSGAIDDLVISVPDDPPPPPGGTEGCTPGYWKNHLDSWATTGYAPNQTLESVFDVPDSFNMDDTTLQVALDGGGGPGAQGGAKILLRAAVASLLNASHPDVDFTQTTAEIIADVNAALASGDRDTMLALATDLDTDNNLGCPLN